jgi:UDP-glucose 4-epimerase
MKTVLVTGGAGFIGSHTVDLLIKRRYKVVVYDNLSTGKQENLNKKAEFVNSDIRDFAALLKATKNASYAIHLAAQISVPKSIKDPRDTFEINEKGTKNVIVACRKNKVKKIVFSSSCAVYGDNPDLPLTEKSGLRPLSPYAESKISCENLLLASGTPFAAFRYFNVYGPRQSADSEYAAAIPIFVSKALKGEPLTIFGDGTQTRDFVNVHDIALANVTCLTKGKGVYNLCSNSAVSVNALSELIVKLTKSSSETLHADERQGDIKHSLGSYAKARKELGWKPLKSITLGLKEYIDWVRK